MWLEMPAHGGDWGQVSQFTCDLPALGLGDRSCRKVSANAGSAQSLEIKEIHLPLVQ
jgi:hypothetical protein